MFQRHELPLEARKFRRQVGSAVGSRAAHPQEVKVSLGRPSMLVMACR